jgi:hypothetical protein
MVRESDVAEGEVLIMLWRLDAEPTEAGEELRPYS